MQNKNGFENSPYQQALRLVLSSLCDGDKVTITTKGGMGNATYKADCKTIGDLTITTIKENNKIISRLVYDHLSDKEIDTINKEVQ